MRVLRKRWWMFGVALVAILVGAAQSLADEHIQETISRQLGNDLFAAGPDIQLAEEIYGDAIAAGDETALLAIEPNDGSELRDILEIADPVAGTIRWR